MLLEPVYHWKSDLSFLDFRKMFLCPWMRVQELSGFASVYWTSRSSAALDYLNVCHDPCEINLFIFPGN